MKGQALYEHFIKERLQPDSTFGLFEPLTKAKIKTFNTFNKKKSVKLEDKVVILKGNCHFFISQSRGIDMKDVIGMYELTDKPLSLIHLDGSLLSGGDGKSALINTAVAASGCEKIHGIRF